MQWNEMCGAGTGWMMAGIGVFSVVFLGLGVLGVVALSKYVFAPRSRL